MAIKMSSQNKQVNEVNNRLVLMCQERNISFLFHGENINTSQHLSDSKLYLSNRDIQASAKIYSTFLEKLN